MRLSNVVVSPAIFVFFSLLAADANVRLCVLERVVTENAADCPDGIRERVLPLTERSQNGVEPELEKPLSAGDQTKFINALRTAEEAAIQSINSYIATMPA